MITRSKSSATRPTLLATDIDINEPTTVYEALTRPEWMTTMKEGVHALETKIERGYWFHANLA